ncbi:MAG: ABC-F family ATP-binding cassette domain-containing protein [Thermodesulfobacteriota bacterium]
MISFDGVDKGFAGQVLFEDVSLRLVAGERAGIVGPNGAGKSTLLALLLGKEQPDRGVVSRARGLSLGHLPQEILATPDATVIGTALRPGEHLLALEEELATLPEELAAATDHAEQERLAARLADVHAEYDRLGGNAREVRARRILAGLGFRPGDEERPLRSFSGGYVMRAELARLLIDLPDVLLLDEPTNHLDLESVLWLQDFLAAYRGTLVLISHDRAFLSATTTSIVEVENGRVTRYPAGYETYVREREERRAQLEAAAKNQERRLRETERFIERFRYKSSKARQVQSRVKALEKEERIVVAKDGPRVRFRFPQPERTSELALELARVAKSYGATRVYEQLDFQLRRGDKTVLVGPNGAGKSTLLKLLAGAIEPDAGERRLGLRVSVGYYTQHRHDMLDLERTVLENAMGVARDQGETVVRSLLGAFLFRGDDVKKKAAVLSGGEKSRLALAMILLDPPTVLLMDEPTIHLDMASVDALIVALQAYEGALCFVSHDVHFIRQIARRVVRVEGGVVTDYPGDWDYYCWKRANGGPSSERASDGGAASAAAADADPLEPERSARGERLERRRAAEARQALARRTRGIRDEIRTLEEEIEELEREKAGLAGDLADPATYQRAGRDVAELQRRYAEVERTLGERTERWLELQEQLEAAQVADGE